MPAAFVAERGSVALSSSSSSTLTVTVAADTTAGNHLVLIAGGHEARTLNTVTDSRGNTWVVDEQRSSAGKALSLAIASALMATPLLAGDTVTLTWSGGFGKARCAVLEEFSGIAASSPKDVSQDNEGTGTSLTSGAGVTTTQADEVAVGGFVRAEDHAFTATGAGYTAFPTSPGVSASDSEARLLGEFKVLSAAGSQQAAANQALSVDWLALIACYKALAATQTVSPSAIGPGEAFGAPTVTPGVATVAPAAIDSEEAVGEPTVVAPAPGTQSILPAGIDSAEAFGSPTVTITAAVIQPVGIESGEAFGAVRVTRQTFPARVDVTATDRAITEVYLSEAVGTVVAVSDSSMA